MLSQKSFSSTERSSSGVVGFIELIAGMFFLVMLALMGIDVCLAIVGASMNDHACRDAARAASAANNRGKAWKLAQGAMKLYQADGYFVTQPTLVPGGFIYNDYNGAPPLDTSPYVTVTTQCDVRLPAPIFFHGVSFMKDGKAQFTQRYTFPIVQTRFVKTMNASM